MCQTKKCVNNGVYTEECVNIRFVVFMGIRDIEYYIVKVNYEKSEPQDGTLRNTTPNRT